VRVEEVAPSSPAVTAGIQPGDIVVSVDGKPITRMQDLVSYVTAHADKEVTIQLQRNGRDLPPITAVPRADPSPGEGPLGIKLGGLNIIPFPGLDGGRLFFVLLGAALRRRLSPQLEAAIHAVGFVLLLGLLVVVSVADIRRATGG